MLFRMLRNVFQHLKWLPNAITFSRIVLATLAFVFALHDQWIAGFWFLAVALSSDFIDRLVAKKLNAISTFGETFDALADSLIVVLGLTSLGITGHLAWWLILGTLALGAVIGTEFLISLSGNGGQP